MVCASDILSEANFYRMPFGFHCIDFGNDLNMSDLKHSTKKAIAWSAADKAGQQALVLVVGIVTMRLLDAEIFGLVAPLVLFTAIANILAEGGFSVALIRKADATETDYNTMFWFNFGLGVIFYLVLYCLSPWIAEYNNMPELAGIARIQFVSVIFYSLGLIQSTLLIKKSNFRRVAQANVFSVFLAAATAIGLALLGYGVWALVGQVLVQSFSKTLLLWILSGWTPRFVYSWTSVRNMFGFSSKLIAGSLANTVSANFYNSALGDYIPQASLGFYERANKIKETGTGLLTHTFGHSISVMLAQLQQQPDRFRQAFRKSMRSISFFLFPAMLGLVVLAAPLVEVVLTAKWLPSVPYIQLLCFSGIFATLNFMHANALKIKGRSDVTLVLDVTSAVLLVGFLLLTIRYGLQVAILSDIAAKLIVFVCYGTASSRILGYRWIDQLRDLLPYAALAVGMGALIWPLQWVIGNTVLLLIGQLVAGAGFYLGLTHILGSRVWQEVCEMLKRR